MVTCMEKGIRQVSQEGGGVQMMNIDDFMPVFFFFLLGVGIGFGGLKLYECLKAETSCERHGRFEICDDRYDDAFERVLSVRDMGFEPSDELTFDLAFFRKWYKKWLELVAHYKEAK